MPALPIISGADSAGMSPWIKGVILGRSGIGKTSLLWTLDPASTLFVDLEAGGLSVEGWLGDRIDVRKAANASGLTTWDFIRGLACFIGGPDPSASPLQSYSAAHYAYVCEKLFGDPAALRKFKTIFFDSITVLSRVCFKWCLTQPQAFNAKGILDTRGAYGLLGQEMKTILMQLQHTPEMNVWMVGILDRVKDEFGRSSLQPQIEGQATAQALDGIFDQVISMDEIDFGEAGKHRAFICHTLNHGGYPAKDRSRQLNEVEEPDLGKLMEKIAAKKRQQVALHFGIPQVDPVAMREEVVLAAVTGQQIAA